MAGIFRPNAKGKSGKYSANFFKPEWKPAKNGAGLNVNNDDFQTFFSLLLEELKGFDKHLVFWTVHEETILKRHLPQQIWRRLEPYLYNVHPLAKGYANRFKKFGADNTAKGKSLEDFLSVMYQKRHPYPPLPNGPSKVCQRIDRACARTQRWKNFTDTQKKYVKDLLAYNEGDCRSTWLIAKRVGNFYASDN
jgi:hypothetical protein